MHFNIALYQMQVNSDGTEYILDDDECPLSILMNHPTSRGKCFSILPDFQPFKINLLLWGDCHFIHKYSRNGLDIIQALFYQ